MSSEIEHVYQQEIGWLFEQFPSYQNIGSLAYKPDLGNIKALISALNIDYSDIKFIHIAGTNGKGTCTNYIGSILIEAGFQTGIFTSPHIIDFRERICVNGENVTKEFVVNFCKQIKSLKINPSFFEITFAMALSYFVEKKCQLVVLETGLGGRLDATNVVIPILSIITNIGLDHVDLLGNTLSKIAFEKAGIIKQSVPVLIGETLDETLPVFEKVAKEKEAKLYLAYDLQVKNSYFKIKNFKQKNEKIILKAIELLNVQGLNINQSAIDLGFQNIHINTNYIGRFQTISEKPLTIVDVAHNEDGITELMNTIQQISYDKLHIIYGSSSDKDFKKIISLFPTDATIYFTEFSSYRSVHIEDVKDSILNIHAATNFYTDIKDSLIAVNKKATESDLILITGSFYLVSDFFEI